MSARFFLHRYKLQTKILHGEPANCQSLPTPDFYSYGSNLAYRMDPDHKAVGSGSILVALESRMKVSTVRTKVPPTIFSFENKIQMYVQMKAFIILQFVLKQEALLLNWYLLYFDNNVIRLGGETFLYCYPLYTTFV